MLTERLEKNIQLVGDDIFVTNTKILSEGIRRHCRLHPDQSQPDRNLDRDFRCYRDGHFCGYTASNLGNSSGETEIPPWPTCGRGRQRQCRSRTRGSLRPHRQNQPNCASKKISVTALPYPGREAGARLMRCQPAYILLALLLLLQYPLWLGKGSWLKVWAMRKWASRWKAQKQTNNPKKRNVALDAEVSDLKQENTGHRRACTQ